MAFNTILVTVVFNSVTCRVTLKNKTYVLEIIMRWDILWDGSCIITISYSLEDILSKIKQAKHSGQEWKPITQQR